jgi:DNA-binding transcriptional ArsR family regulator
MADRVAVFVSYSHRDDVWLRRLQVHLRPLARGGALDLWDDTRIVAGQRWRDEIALAIDRAAVAILLISADFLASDFVYEEELPPLLAKAEREGALILPIVVTPCRLGSQDALAVFQAVNAPNRPLSRLDPAEAEEVFVRVADRVADVLEELKEGPPTVAEAVLPDENGQNGRSEALFEELRLGWLAREILRFLADASRQEAPIFSEIYRALGMQSRKAGHEALTRLVDCGWVTQQRCNRRTELTITREGSRQWQRLTAATGGTL